MAAVAVPPALASPPLLLVAAEASERARGFAAAAAARGQGVQVLDWGDWLRGEVDLSALSRDTVVRLDSPGDDTALQRHLQVHGLRRLGDDDAAERLLATPLEPGRLGFTEAHYRGLCAAADDLLAALPAGVVATTTAGDLEVLFDKRRCHARCRAAGIAVPEALTAPGDRIMDFDDLRARMLARGCWRVFVKPAHGSAAAGVLALALASGDRARGYTSLQLVRDHAGVRLYHHRTVRQVEGLSAVRELVDALAHEPLHVEAWVPKLSLLGHSCDQRVLVLDGRAQHVVPRLSRSPLTNLHLGAGNHRGAPAELRARVGEAVWRAMLASCEALAAQFEHSLLVAVDVGFTARGRGHRVFEANAFGDWLKRSWHDSLDPWQAWLQALPGWLQRHRQAGS